MTTLARAGVGRRAMPDGITIYPVERLGNQLFTYAAGLAQARRLGCPYYVNEGFYRHLRPQRHHGAHQYDLASFDSGLVSPADPAAHIPVALGLPAVPAFAWWHRHVGPRVPGAPVYMERSFAYDPGIAEVRPGTTLMGFFQSWAYFDAVADELRARLARINEPSAWYAETAARIRPGDGSIVLNVRRGDYLLPTQQKIQGLASRAYYERALRLMRRAGLDGPVYVMSDSLDAVLDELAGLAELVPLAPPPGTNLLEAVLVLSRADGLAAANSSFSWWGGYLRADERRIVVAPRPWFTRSVDTRDLLPRDWVTLDRD